MLSFPHGEVPGELYGPRRLIHSVEVTADTLYEAVAQAISDFREDRTVSNPPGPETDFVVLVLRKPIEHVIKLKRVQEWAEHSNTTGPAEKMRRERVRKMLEARAS